MKAKKILSLFFALCIMLGAISVGVYAAEDQVTRPLEEPDVRFAQGVYTRQPDGARETLQLVSGGNLVVPVADFELVIDGKEYSYVVTAESGQTYVSSGTITCAYILETEQDFIYHRYWLTPYAETPRGIRMMLDYTKDSRSGTTTESWTFDTNSAFSEDYNSYGWYRYHNFNVVKTEGMMESPSYSDSVYERKFVLSETNEVLLLGSEDGRERQIDAYSIKVDEAGDVWVSLKAEDFIYEEKLGLYMEYFDTDPMQNQYTYSNYGMNSKYTDSISLRTYDGINWTAYMTIYDEETGKQKYGIQYAAMIEVEYEDIVVPGEYDVTIMGSGLSNTGEYMVTVNGNITGVFEEGENRITNISAQNLAIMTFNMTNGAYRVMDQSTVEGLIVTVTNGEVSNVSVTGRAQTSPGNFDRYTVTCSTL